MQNFQTTAPATTFIPFEIGTWNWFCWCFNILHHLSIQVVKKPSSSWEKAPNSEFWPNNRAMWKCGTYASAVHLMFVHIQEKDTSIQACHYKSVWLFYKHEMYPIKSSSSMSSKLKWSLVSTWLVATVLHPYQSNYSLSLSPCKLVPKNLQSHSHFHIPPQFPHPPSLPSTSAFHIP